MARMLRLTAQQFEAHQRRIGRHRPAVSPKCLQRVPSAITGHPRRNKWELELARQMQQAGLPDALQQFRFARPERGFIADFCYLHLRLVIEVEGQVHSIRAQRECDVERRQWMLLNGWDCLPVTNRQVASGEALRVVSAALALGLPKSEPAPASPSSTDTQSTRR